MDDDTIQELLLRFKGSAQPTCAATASFAKQNSGEGGNAARPNFHGRVLTNVSMAKCTTMRVGGIAPIVIEPFDISSLLFALRAAKDIFVMGGGSNVIVSDEGFDTPVISTRALDAIEVLPPVGGNGTPSAVPVRCGAGTAMSRLVEYCTEQGLSGIEAFAGLPGTVGGAVYMNARCFGLEVSDVLLSADYVPLPLYGGADWDALPSIPAQHYEMDKSQWQYKVSPFQGMKSIITSATFLLMPCRPSIHRLTAALGDRPSIHRLTAAHFDRLNAPLGEQGENARDAIAAKCKEYIEKRRSKGHFRAPSAGSVFRNNHAFGKPSGKLIDEAGLKGFSIGGAQIAPWHGNIIINNGTATALDVAALVKAAHDTVKEKTGFDMQCEVVFCGK